MDQLGWVGPDPNSEEIVTLREKLLATNGIKGLEVLEPTDVEEAVRLFYRDGFVVVTNALDDEALGCLQAGSERETRTMMALDPERHGNRGSHRYSFGGASVTSHLMHLPEWTR